MPRKGENIYKRKDGRWEGRCKSGENATGKPKYRSVYGKTYQEVKLKLIKLRSQPKNIVKSGNITVGELFSEWLSAIKLRVKPSTFANYQMKIDKHILPVFSHLHYEILDNQAVQKFISDKINDGLSAKYVSDIIIVFKSMAKYVSRVHGFRNALSDVILPKIAKKEMVILSEKQQKKLCGYLQKNPDITSVCILLSMYTGLRIGEICGLKWSDIDFEKSTIAVRRTVQRVNSAEKGTKLMIGSPKSQASRRCIPVQKFLLDMLEKYRNEADFFVLSGSRKAVEPRTLQHRFKSILEKADLPSVNFHSLRHLFATNCIKVGFDVKTLSEILGHASVETTLNRYVHSSMEQKNKCMNLLSFVA